MSRSLALPRAAAPRRPLLRRLLSLLALSRTRRSLAELDARGLRDIGVSDTEAEQEAARRLWDVPAHWRL